MEMVVGKRSLGGGEWEDITRDFGEPGEYREWQKATRGFDITLPFGDLIETYIYEVFIPDRTLRFNTKRNYMNAYRLNMQGSGITKIPFEDVQAIDLQLFYNKTDGPCCEIRMLNNLLIKVYDFLQLWTDVINIARVVRPPAAVNTRKSHVEVWSDDDLKKIMAGLSTNPRIRFMIILLINTGCRISEILGLKESDFKNGAVNIERQLLKKHDLAGKSNITWYELAPPKSNDGIRRIPVTAKVMDELSLHTAWHDEEMLRRGCESDLLFTSMNGRPVDKRMLSLNFKNYYESIGVEPKGFHVYRHTFGTNLCRSGVPIQVASKLLGHSSVKVTSQYYVNIDDQQKMEAIEKYTKGLDDLT
jgi:integrase